MHITGIIDSDNAQEVLDAIKYLMNAANKKISISEYECRFKNREIRKDYWSALVQIGTEILLIKIKEKDLNEAIDTLTFDCIILTDLNQWEKFYPKICHLSNDKLKKIKLIMNRDIIKTSNFSDVEKYKVLSYGFSLDSDITASSTGEPYSSGQFLCCVKSCLVSADGNRIEPHEFIMNPGNITNNSYNLLAAASFAVLHEIDLNRIIQYQQ